MAQTVLVTLTVAGADTGPFNIYTDADGYTVPVATNVPKASLLAGYSVTVPDLATIIQVKSTGVCTNSYFMPVVTTTTTSTSTSSTSTSTTTTTTTTLTPISLFYSSISVEDVCTTTNTTTIYTSCDPIVANCLFWYDAAGTIPADEYFYSNHDTGAVYEMYVTHFFGTGEVAIVSSCTTSCTDCYRWQWVIESVPTNDVVHYYSCADGSEQTKVITNGDVPGPDDPFGILSICNCDDLGNPTTDNGTVLTQTARCTEAGEWYQLQNCFLPTQYLYTIQYPANSFAVGDRVLNGLDVFTVSSIDTVPPVFPNDLEISPALNPVTFAQLTGCPDIVELLVEPYYDDFSEGDKVRAEWSTPAVSGPELGFSGVVERYLNNGCNNYFNTTYFAPGGLNAVAIDNGTYQLQTSCQNLGGSTSPLPSPSKLKITELTIYTQATPFARDVNGCPTDFSGATTVVTATANNYLGTYRFNIYDPIAGDYIYFSIIGCFTCPL